MEFDVEDLAVDSEDELNGFGNLIVNNRNKLKGIKRTILEFITQTDIENSIFVTNGVRNWCSPKQIAEVYRSTYFSNKVKASWVWELSQPQDSKFYVAQYFDRRSKNTKRGIKKTVAFRLSENGLKSLINLRDSLNETLSQKEVVASA